MLCILIQNKSEKQVLSEKFDLMPKQPHHINWSLLMVIKINGTFLVLKIFVNITCSVSLEPETCLSDNSRDDNAVNYTDGSVVWDKRYAWDFTGMCPGLYGRTAKEAISAFTAATSSLTMETMAVTKPLSWLQSQDFNFLMLMQA